MSEGGIVGGDGLLKAKSSGVIGERVIVLSMGSCSLVDELSLELIEDDDVPLFDGVLFLRLKLKRNPWKSLRLKMNYGDDKMKVRMGMHFIKRKWYRSGMG
ncbi:hypothetical protein Tco_0053978 [Tanacetum coccineum]